MPESVGWGPPRLKKVSAEGPRPKKSQAQLRPRAARRGGRGPHPDTWSPGARVEADDDAARRRLAVIGRPAVTAAGGDGVPNRIRADRGSPTLPLAPTGHSLAPCACRRPRRRSDVEIHNAAAPSWTYRGGSTSIALIELPRLRRSPTCPTPMRTVRARAMSLVCTHSLAAPSPIPVRRASGREQSSRRPSTSSA